MSAPIAVNTADGVCWTRRGALRGGEALYAPEGVCDCPPFVMATLAELAEHGIVGSADALPMPIGPEPQQPRTVLDRARAVLGARVAKDDLQLALGNVIEYAVELERQRNAFRDQRNNVVATNEQLLAKVEESEQARLRAENDARTLKREFAERDAETFVPRTERSYWVDIAAALNAAESVGMSIGIDLDGTLTDRNAWSVIWDRDAKRWTVAGYDEDEGLSGPCDCGEGAVHYTTADCPAAQRAAEAGGTR